MKIFYFLSIFFLTGMSFSQSKKEQIEQLTNRVDSLNQVLSSERSASSQKVSEFNATISNLESKISSLNATISNLNLELQTSKADASSKQTELNSKQQEITNLEAQVKQKTDSLALVLVELEKLKPTPKPVVSNNTANQVTQTGSYKSVKIGTQTWMAENLNVSTFRNGDPIMEAKTNEEWEKAGKEGKPAWCNYENDPKNGAKYGKLYNWYAVNDPRGLAPAGWHVPSDAEWTTLGDQLGDEASNKMKSTSGWNGYGCKRC
jgi:TolA-binding protein